MSEGTTSKRLPRSLDPRKQAHMNALYEGYLSAAELPRLADVVHSIDEIQVRLAFYIESQGERAISVKIDGQVEVICQRCLKPKAVTVDVESILVVVRNEDEAKQLPERYEPWIVSDVETDTYELVEEELLLNIPAVSYHDYSCIDSSLLEAGHNEQTQEEPKDNPFTVLAGLKDKLPKD